MKTEYTPGPWDWTPGGAIYPTQRKTESNEIVIADCMLQCLPHDRERFRERLANARLIAAAPDLLDVARSVRMRLVGRFGRNNPPDWVFDELARLDAAIARAEGK